MVFDGVTYRVTAIFGGGAKNVGFPTNFEELLLYINSTESSFYTVFSDHSAMAKSKRSRAETCPDMPESISANPTESNFLNVEDIAAHFVDNGAIGPDGIYY